jgi:hypothetical protein
MRDPTFRELRWTLLRSGIAPKHVKGMLKELRHHYAELHEAATNSGLSPEAANDKAMADLGDPNLIVTEALAKPELQSWAQRWPWLIYGVLPLVTPIILTLSLGLLTIVAVDSDFIVSRTQARPVHTWIAEALHGMRLFIMYVLPVLLAAGWAGYAARRNAPLFGPTAAILLVAAGGCGVNLYVDLPTEVGEMGQIGGGWGYFGHFWNDNLMRLGATVAIVLGPYLVWRHNLKNAEPG